MELASLHSTPTSWGDKHHRTIGVEQVDERGNSRLLARHTKLSHAGRSHTAASLPLRDGSRVDLDPAI